MHGGGNLGNLWLNEEIFRRKIISDFPDNKIIIFPQSLYFTNDAEGENQLAESQKIYNAHSNLHLMLRDQNSFDLAQKIFPQIETYLLPDAVTSLFGILDEEKVQREGVLFILRRDKEKVRDDSKIQTLQNYLAENNIAFETVDTVVAENVSIDNREEKIFAVLRKIHRSKLVITDRFHGVVFSVVTRTPVLAFKSFDTKISSGIKWFKDFESVFYAQDENFSAMQKFIDKVFVRKLSTDYKLNFEKKFLDVLKKFSAGEKDHE